MKISRRSFLKAAAAIGASLAWVGPAQGSRVNWHERRDLYPQGVASGDPDPHSVILWTRRPFAAGTRQILTVEVAEDEAFSRVIAHAKAPISSAADWTARVLIGRLKPASTYWYRFTDSDGNGSRAARSQHRCQDGGRAFNGGNPPPEIRFNDAHVPTRNRARRRKRFSARSRRHGSRTSSGAQPRCGNLGQLAGCARSARRPPEPARPSPRSLGLPTRSQHWAAVITAPPGQSALKSTISI
jgi:hypothetical protein